MDFNMQTQFDMKIIKLEIIIYVMLIYHIYVQSDIDNACK